MQDLAQQLAIVFVNFWHEMNANYILRHLKIDFFDMVPTDRHFAFQLKTLFLMKRFEYFPILWFGFHL